MTGAGGSVNFIGGEWVAGRGTDLTSYDPSTGEPVWTGASATSQQVRDAVAALRLSAPAWEATDVSERRRLLARFAELVSDNAEELSLLVAREVGKPLWEAKTEVGAVAAKLAPTVEAYDRRASPEQRDVSGMESWTRFRPLGVVAVVGPFNFPLSMVNTHVMPALLAGTCVAIKPSEHAPALATEYFRLLLEAGVPEGVVALVNGEADTALALADYCDGLYLTGSRQAGVALQARAAGRSDILLALEMGGNSPLVVWDYDEPTPVLFGTIQSAFISAGQRCSAARRLIVPHDSDFVDRLVQALHGIRVGMPLSEPEPYFGPLISRRAADALQARYDELVAAGAVVLLPFERIGESKLGNLVRPCALDVTGLAVDDVEHFGPLLLVQRVASIDEAIDVANATEYGLAAGIYCTSRDLYEEFRLGVRAGIVNWNQSLTGAVGNAPFGGTKASGNFRPGGFLSVDYCNYAVASLEVRTPLLPEVTPPGIGI